jgi:hypothetical protein
VFRVEGSLSRRPGQAPGNDSDEASSASRPSYGRGMSQNGSPNVQFSFSVHDEGHHRRRCCAGEANVPQQIAEKSIHRSNGVS